MLQSKIWGTTEEIISNEIFEVHRICVKKGGYCSKHYHNYKFNMFFVESGVIEVDTIYEDHINTTVLKSGQSTVVSPNELHVFRAPQNTIAYEIYWVRLPKEDIIRKNDGGLDRESPERIFVSNIDKDDESIQKHVSRYKFASMFIDGVVLDCACGSGYGSKILSKKADKVIGVDISEDTVKFISRNNNNPNISFVCENLKNLKFDENSLNSIVSLETLEHVSKEDMVDFLNKSSKWISDGGCFVGSSPMLRYKDGEPYVTNPYHINELPREELIEIVESCFGGFKISFFHQEYKSFKVLHEEDTGFCVFVARKC